MVCFSPIFKNNKIVNYQNIFFKRQYKMKILKNLLQAILCSFLFTIASVHSQSKIKVSDKMNLIGYSNVKLYGYVGSRLDSCIKNRITQQDFEIFVAPFRLKEEKIFWQTEFWGKWITSAMPAYEYNHDLALKQKIDSAVVGLLRTQEPNGYIGNYKPDAHLRAWDVWGRKYTMLGLIGYFDLTGNKDALAAAARVADHLMTEVGPGKRDIYTTGLFTGLPSSSNLEPIVLLYRRTGDDKYLKFAEYIVENMELGNSKLISQALANIPVADRFVGEKQNTGRKAYEMMSCYEGILELYRVTGKPEYLKAVIASVDNMLKDEINMLGSGTSEERWYHGNDFLPDSYASTMETCVTLSWMKICCNLLQFTGNPKYADEIEKSTYNALLGSMMPNGSTFAMYSPSAAGFRALGGDQCNMPINCCIANGGRAMMLIPKITYTQTSDTIFANLFIISQAKFLLPSKKNVIIRQTSEYPKNESVNFEITSDKKTKFSIAIRIPKWSEKNRITVNGIQVNDSITPGTYYVLKRDWKTGDKIEYNPDMRGKVVYSPGKYNRSFAIVRGPVVLARDSRINSTSIDESLLFSNKYIEPKIIDLKPITDLNNYYMVYGATFHYGTLINQKHKPFNIIFCDYASAGNAWNENNRYRVWSQLVQIP